jgi:hypothetical protein
MGAAMRGEDRGCPMSAAIGSEGHGGRWPGDGRKEIEVLIAAVMHLVRLYFCPAFIDPCLYRLDALPTTETYPWKA